MFLNWLLEVQQPTDFEQDEKELHKRFPNGYLYVNSDANHYKFWHAKIDGTKVIVSWGRIGTKGQEQVKDFNSSSQAMFFVNQKIQEKKKKGYEESKPGQKSNIGKRQLGKKGWIFRKHKDYPILAIFTIIGEKNPTELKVKMEYDFIKQEKLDYNDIMAKGYIQYDNSETHQDIINWLFNLT